MTTGRHRASGRSPRVFAVIVAMLALLIVGVLVRSTFGSKAGPSGARGASPAVPSTAPTRPRDGSATPSASSTPVRRGKLVIHGAGDTNVQPDYIGVSPSNYGYLLSGMNGLFLRDDLSVVNLECPASKVGSPLPKEFAFRCDPGALPFLKRGGIEVANMANNHSWDLGPDALEDTRRNIEGAGMAAVGAGRDPDEAEEPAIFHLNGWTVAVVGLDEVVDPPQEVAGPDHPGTACGHDVGCMVRAIRRAAEASDLVVVDIHWGVELDTQPRGYQVEQGKRFVAAGADVIFGGHSHRLQPLSFVHGKPVFWSLGNFVWPHFSEEGARTAVGEVVVRPSGRITAELLPVYIAASGHPVLSE